MSQHRRLEVTTQALLLVGWRVDASFFRTLRSWYVSLPEAKVNSSKVVSMSELVPGE